MSKVDPDFSSPKNVASCPELPVTIGSDQTTVAYGKVGSVLLTIFSGHVMFGASSSANGKRKKNIKQIFKSPKINLHNLNNYHCKFNLFLEAIIKIK